MVTSGITTANILADTLVVSGVSTFFSIDAGTISGDGSGLTNVPGAFSGDYDDLTNKPTIPDNNVADGTNNYYLHWMGTWFHTNRNK